MKRDEAAGVSDAFEDRSRRGSRSPERPDRVREKSHDRPSGVPRRGSARKAGEHRREGALEPSSGASSRRCAADSRAGSFRPRTARYQPPASAARPKRRALERDRISPPRKGASRAKNSARRIRRRRGAFARPRERAITRRRSIDDRSIDGIGASRGASEPRSREKAVLQNEHRLVVRGRRARGAGGETHLLPWGCHTIMELVLAALPVETTGALLRTGATAERAAILSCG
jgi:hypothetical protein